MPLWSNTQLELDCYPQVPEHIGRAWDAADDYLIQHIPKETPVLIINDRHAALSCYYPQAQTWYDSACTQLALAEHRARNVLTPVAQLIAPNETLNDNIKHVLIKVPKSFDLLKYWLSECAERLPEDTRYYLAGMAKHIPIAWLKQLESVSSRYKQHPIVRKARLLELSSPNIFMSTTKGYTSPTGLTLNALPGVFSRQSLDQGSAVLLPYVTDQLSITGTVCDLGCGNGLLGLSIKQTHSDAHVILTDDSLLAVTSAQANAHANQLDVDVRHGHCLQAVQETLDWVICNPPFHEGHKELINIAKQMFHDGAQQLKVGGQMLIIANRHLPYLPMLKALFNQVNVISNDRKFSVYLCQR